jgi:single-stranded DNA-binding protein
MNRCVVSGQVSESGLTLVYTEAGKPQATFTLICEEPGREGGTYKTFIPVLVVGPQAEAMAERLEPGDVVLLEGKLAYCAGKTKDSGKLVVVGSAVEILIQVTTSA